VGAVHDAGQPLWVIAVHGGAGDLRRRVIGDERTEAGLDAIATALGAGADALARGDSALDAVVAAVRIMEDDEELNAGRGAALSEDGIAELDAAVADGATRRAGAVAAVRTVRHPVDVALAVLQDERHVLLVGGGAERFARQRGLETVHESWFVTDRQRTALQDARRASGGTVGAVALDASGHLAAATSTGGMTGKRAGRVGDSPIIGAGTWADDRTVAVSGTGHGEAFLRTAFAHDVHARMLLASRSLGDACDDAIAELRSIGARGGCVAVDRTGQVVMPFTTLSMFRGWTSPGGPVMVGVERGECAPR
jgi:isoaspartyl peptidase/L-asparaginase-like protein (Ntn-hydrolase superfamily)